MVVISYKSNWMGMSFVFVCGKAQIYCILITPSHTFWRVHLSQSRRETVRIPNKKRSIDSSILKSVEKYGQTEYNERIFEHKTSAKKSSAIVIANERTDKTADTQIEKTSICTIDCN